MEKRRRDAIKDLYLNPRESYTATELAAMFSATVDEILYYCDTEEQDVAQPDFIIEHEWARTLACYFFFGAAEIEDALGTKFDSALPATRRTRTVTVRLPVFVIDYIEDRARTAGRGIVDLGDAIAHTITSELMGNEPPTNLTPVSDEGVANHA